MEQAAEIGDISMDEQQKPMVLPITLFYSYAHEDELLRNELEKHLSPLQRQGLIAEWHDRQILAGDEWTVDINQHLEAASIILLLISPDFLASDYCYDTEMKRALERHQRGEARVIPIILRPCNWLASPFARLQCLPRDGKAVTTWQNPDEAFLTIAEGLRRLIERQRISTRPLSHVARQNRTRLIKRIRATWIEGVLEHSLHQAALIALDLQEQPDALANPWRFEVQETNVLPHLLPAGTPLVQIYDEAEGELLILGEPGAGKTTLLLHLASDLLKRAEQENASPMPVIFMLSSWAEKRLPLPDWLIEELFTKYQVPRNLGRSWVKDEQLLLLLDGLDEVTQVHRSACIQAINAYRQEHNLVPVVLCSRKAEYEAQSTRVTLSKAVVIQPLSSQQIDDYLTQAGQQLEAVRSLLREDQELQELARTPLMLTILALVYQGKAVDDLVMHMPPEMRRQHVFERYVERMLNRRGTKTSYPLQQTRGWLAWLARQMKQHSQTVFYMERMQPNWLPEPWLHRPYYRAVVRLGLGIASGLIIFLTLGIAVGLFFGTAQGPGIGFVSGLFGGFVSGLAGGLVMALTSRVETEIQPAEVVVWSWRRLVQVRSLKRKLLVGISSGLALSLLMGLAFAVNSSGVSALRLVLSVLAIALVVLVIIVLASGSTSGVASTLQNEHDLTLPNQGMRQSVRNSLRIGVISGLVGGSISIMAFSLILTLIGMEFTTGLVGWLCFLLFCGSLGGTITGLINGLPNGGIAYMQHLVLRLFLWRSNLIPWDYPRFLDYAAERILLRKIGGGYIFIHRLLLDYFASLQAPSSPDET